MTRKYTKPVRGKKTREEWLTSMVKLLHAEVFTKLPGKGKPHGVSRLLPKYRVSCSWPGGGSARKRIGECWSPSASATGHTEMFISPRMSDVVKVVETLVHEMVHMYMFQLPQRARHRPQGTLRQAGLCGWPGRQAHLHPR